MNESRLYLLIAAVASIATFVALALFKEERTHPEDTTATEVEEMMKACLCPANTRKIVLQGGAGRGGRAWVCGCIEG